MALATLFYRACRFGPRPSYTSKTVQTATVRRWTSNCLPPQPLQQQLPHPTRPAYLSPPPPPIPSTPVQLASSQVVKSEIERRTGRAVRHGPQAERTTDRHPRTAVRPALEEPDAGRQSHAPQGRRRRRLLRRTSAGRRKPRCSVGRTTTWKTWKEADVGDGAWCIGWKRGAAGRTRRWEQETWRKWRW